MRLIPSEIRRCDCLRGRGLLVDWPQKVEHLDDALRPQVEVFLHQLRELFIRNLARALGGHHDAGRPRDPYGVRNLHQAFRRQTRGNDVLRHVARCISGGAVDLGGILARERAAPVRGRAAVGVHDDLAAGEPAVALGTADLEAAGRIDQEIDLALHITLGQHRLDDLFDDSFLDLIVLHSRRVLRRQHHGFDRVRLAVGVADGDLRFGVGPQPGKPPVAAQLRLALDEPVRHVDRERHQLRRFVASVPEHQSLVAGALIEVEAATFVHALGDVLRLLAVGHDHGAGVGVESDLRVVVADALDRLARDVVEVDPRSGGDFAGEHDEVVLDERLRRDSGTLVLS